MACPFFHPTVPRSHAADSRFAMLPLGDSWEGLCLADQQSPAVPDEHSLHRICNFGYGRERCPRFQGAGAPDAIRFSLAGDDGATVRILWAAELDHRPAGHGQLRFERATGAAIDGTAPPEVHRLAGAYLASYLRRSDMEQ